VSQASRPAGNRVRSKVREILHDIKCNVVMERPRTDRFFMDMRVYDVLPHAIRDMEGQSVSLIWRGIYLAVEVTPGAELGPRSRG
jgi:hypothetical protein